MNVIYKFLLTLLFIFSVTHHSSANENTISKEITENFIQDLTSGEIRKAITSMYDRNNFLQTRATEIELLISQSETTFLRFGNLVNFELTRIEKLTPVLERHIYQLFYNDFPVHVIVFTYKDDENWVISSFKFNTNSSIIKPIAHANDEIENEPLKTATNILDSFFSNNLYDALISAFENTNKRFIPDTAITSIEKQVNLIISILGKPVSYHKLSHEKFSSKNVRLIYILNLDTHPIPVILDFYKKPNNDWALQSINLNDEFKNIDATIP